MLPLKSSIWDFLHDSSWLLQHAQMPISPSNIVYYHYLLYLKFTYHFAKVMAPCCLFEMDDCLSS